MNDKLFSQFDGLALFCRVAKFNSFTQAATALHMTKGAISYQVQQLEQALGFEVFVRQPRGVSLTPQGRDLLVEAEASFTQLRQYINELQGEQNFQLTVGMSSYFAARWLAPRLVNFMHSHGDVDMRIQPLADQEDSLADHIDVAIRWGDGSWLDVDSELLWMCKVFPCVGKQMAADMQGQDLQYMLNKLPRLRDRGGSEAWSKWMQKAGLNLQRQGQDHLIITDPSVRLQYVISNQGLGFYDELAQAELDAGLLQRISEVELDDHGYYLVTQPGKKLTSAALVFCDWIREEVLASQINSLANITTQSLFQVGGDARRRCAILR